MYSARSISLRMAGSSLALDSSGPPLLEIARSMPESFFFVSLPGRFFGRRNTVVPADFVGAARTRLCVPGKALCGSGAWQGSFATFGTDEDPQKRRVQRGGEGVPHDGTRIAPWEWSDASNLCRRGVSHERTHLLSRAGGGHRGWSGGLHDCGRATLPRLSSWRTGRKRGL